MIGGILQAHLWSFYEEASVFGKEVHTTGGSRGPSRAFFVPSLSAMQLFVYADSSTPSGSLHTLSDGAAAQVCIILPRGYVSAAHSAAAFDLQDDKASMLHAALHAHHYHH